MNLNILKPRLALNKAYLKVKPNRNEIEQFKENLIKLIDRINETESEEFHKNLVSDFLKNTYYDANHFINTKGRNDLVIHTGKDAKSSVGVIIEAKKPTNKSEMIKKDNINAKAFQELVLYYLRERITNKNLEIKFLIATNIYEWFIFDAQLFEKQFAENKELVKKFIDFEEGRLSGFTTDFFYREIAQSAIAEINTEIAFAYFDIREYENPLRNNDKNDDNILIALYKLLSPENLLKLPFANDSNSLDKTFYSELLHIIGLTETKNGSKKLIERKKVGERNPASLIESAIDQLDSLDKISRLPKPSQFGATYQERLFNVALELSITWINRILFLKLLEAQLIKYHKGDKDYSFLSLAKIKNFDDLNSLFFSVLARKQGDRRDSIKKMFANVPYLNSSLFEPTSIEQTCIFISNLKDEDIPIFFSTVLKDANGNKKSGSLPVINYIFEFLEAYDFASEGSEDIQEDNKRLINASVLGLIFEKINGYKDGSFFTPGFITMYMCRETLRRAVLQKFNDAATDSVNKNTPINPDGVSETDKNTPINDASVISGSRNTPLNLDGGIKNTPLNPLSRGDLEENSPLEFKSPLERGFRGVPTNDIILSSKSPLEKDFDPNSPLERGFRGVSNIETENDQGFKDVSSTDKDNEPRFTGVPNTTNELNTGLTGVSTNDNIPSSKSPLERGFRGVSNIETENDQGFNDVSISESEVSPISTGMPLQDTEQGSTNLSLNENTGISNTKTTSQRRNIIPYNPALKEIARELRNNSTKSEIILWLELKGKFDGKYDFHRQKPLDNYIADFYCYELNLVIELDGITHNWADTQNNDYHKELRLNELGLNVLRFNDKAVFDNLDDVLEIIKKYIKGFEKRDLSEFKYDDTPLNPFSKGDYVLPEKNTPLNCESSGSLTKNTPLNPLSRGDLKEHRDLKTNPLSRGGLREGGGFKKDRFNSLDDVYNAIGREIGFDEANQIVNSLKICDPAVGSGHFLVSALNEIISIKSELGILTDKHGKRLRDYNIEVANDELVITDEDGKIFEYNPNLKESQRVQETIFYEKQTIIENCLFGVDINPNSVKICRLRLWIELLKNAYYKSTDELETLPNIDINIKCGNSLISRFPLDADLAPALKKSKWSIDTYRIAVDSYRNAKNKEDKREFERLINEIKGSFSSEISTNDPKLKRLGKLSGDLFTLQNQTVMFERTKKEIAEWNKQVHKLSDEIRKLEAEIEEIKNNKIYDNAFEWRFEFPEVLNDDGDFVGFDVVIGNPPYIRSRESMNVNEKNYYFTKFTTISYQPDLYKLFIEFSTSISTTHSKICLITPSVFLSNEYDKNLRQYLSSNHSISFVSIPNDKVFDEANVSVTIFLLEQKHENSTIEILNNSNNHFIVNRIVPQRMFEKDNYIINTNIEIHNFDLINKIEYSSVKLGQIFDVKNGIKVRKELIFKEASNNDYKPFALGKDIVPIGNLNYRWYIHYIKENENKFTNQAFRSPEIFENEKLVIRQIPSKYRIIATIDRNKIYTDQTIYNILATSIDYNLNVLLAILSSKLMFFYFKNTLFDNKDLFPKIKRSQILELPIKLSNSKEIINLVDQILSHKQADPHADTSALEAEIDRLVYELYGLTEEEIRVVDPDLK